MKVLKAFERKHLVCGLLPVWLMPGYANSACISNSIGLRWPNVECRRLGL